MALVWLRHKIQHGFKFWNPYFRQKEENQEIVEGEGESDEASVNGDDSRMDEEVDNDTLKNGEQAL